MREWEELVHDLETSEVPLTVESMSRIQKKVKEAMPRRHRKWLPIVLAASLLLSACGYAAATGQFDRWFRNFAADPAAPEESADLLTQMGTVIGQSQTVDDVTLTLEGALWDGEELVLSLTIEEGALPETYMTSVETEGSWLRTSRAQMLEDLRERDPEYSQEELDGYLEDIGTRWNAPEILLWRDRDTKECFLQVREEYRADREASEVTLHLEDLNLMKTTLKGPYEFTFNVERRAIQSSYTGSVLIEHEALEAPLEITRIVLAPFRTTAEFRSDAPLPDGVLLKEVCIDRLRIGGEEVSAGYSGSSSVIDGKTGSITAGPRDRIVDPASVEAVEIGGVWIELSDLTPEGS